MFYHLQPRSVENSRNSRSMENLDRPAVTSNHSSSSQNRRTSTESGPNQLNPDQKPVKKRSVDESGRSRKTSSKSSDSPSSSSGPKTRTSENRRSRTEGQEPTPPSAARSSAVLQSSINPLLTDVRLNIDNINITLHP